MASRFSIIIPAFNEAGYLPRLLESIRLASLAFPQGAVEIIVSDNSSTDDTAVIARSAGCKIAQVAKRSIAAARNGGAAVASGEIFCFIDADSALNPDTFSQIDEAMRNTEIIVGATGVYLERWSAGLIIMYSMMIPFVWLTGLDTGVVFCRRDDFEVVGGYDESMLLAEDVDFLYKLKRLGWSRGQRFRRLKGVKALGSTRKFDEHGDWHYFTLLTKVISYMFRVRFRIDPQQDIPEITRYWYHPNR